MQTIYKRATSYSIVNPKDVSNLMFLLDADNLNGFTLTGTGGDEVSQYIERSGNAYTGSQTTAANRPKRVLNALDGKAVIRFDGTNDTLSFGDILDLQSTSWTRIAIYKTTALNGSFPSGPYSKGSSSNSTGTWGIFYFSSTVMSYYLNVNGGTSESVALPATALNNWYTMEDIINRSTLTAGVSVNKGAYQSNRSVGNSNFNTALPFMLGTGYLVSDSNPNPSVYWAGDLAYMAFYNKILSATERKGIYNYLKRKYPSLNFSYEI
ncbi:hypothetical protein [Xanthocytophaga flava]|uniref:hypothetical protein n=1 Tax=Xanthocytophaga flava TaxID=3048013 RepID=UPI0028D0F9F7|nr:hypothetical protein [Xanthocytophaga flavus]MDJ1472852.1 hypothetical protein [Xanthocytophaga flavus]